MGAPKSFPNAPDYELKLSSGLIAHLAAVSGKGKSTWVLYGCSSGSRTMLYHPSFRTVTVTGEETRRTKDPGSVFTGGDKESEETLLKGTTARWHRRSSPQWVSSG